MLRALGSLVTTALLLGISGCTTGSQTNSPTNANSSPSATITATASPTATASATTTVAPGSPSPGGAPTTAAVKGTNFKWTDSVSGTNVTTIKVGGTVTFTAQGNHKLAHDTSSVGNGCGDLEASFDSTPITQPITRTFNKVGTFGYHCGVHGGTPNCNSPSDSDGMAAVIKVVP
jgi:plastocyanin